MISAIFDEMAFDKPSLLLARSRPEQGTNLTLRLAVEGRPDDLPTPRSMALTSFRVHVWCKACRNAKDADLGALIAAGRGDVPLIQTKWRCSNSVHGG